MHLCTYTHGSFSPPYTRSYYSVPINDNTDTVCVGIDSFASFDENSIDPYTLYVYDRCDSALLVLSYSSFTVTTFMLISYLLVVVLNSS